MTVVLPEPSRTDTVTLAAALSSRRTCRDFSSEPIGLAQVSHLLWSAQGLTGTAGGRAAPSAGAQYPLELLVVAGAVADLAVGLHRYHAEAHQLELLDREDRRTALWDAALDDQPWVRDAAAVIVVAADMRAIGEHFEDQVPLGARGRRYALIETGAVCQNVHLVATALGLGLVLVGGFDDDAVTDALGLDLLGHEPTAMLAVGHPR